MEETTSSWYHAGLARRVVSSARRGRFAVTSESASEGSSVRRAFAVAIMVALMTLSPPAAGSDDADGVSFDELISFGTTVMPVDPEAAFRAAAAARYDVGRALDEAAMVPWPAGPRASDPAWSAMLRHGIARHVVYAGRRYRADDVTGQRGILMACEKPQRYDLDLRRHGVHGTPFAPQDLARARGDLPADSAQRASRSLLRISGEAGANAYHLTSQVTLDSAPQPRWHGNWEFTYTAGLPSAACPAYEPLLAFTGLMGPNATIVGVRSTQGFFGEPREERLAAPPGGLPTTVTFTVGAASGEVMRGSIIRLHIVRTRAKDPRLTVPSDYMRPDALRRTSGIVSVIESHFLAIGSLVPEPDGAFWYLRHWASEPVHVHHVDSNANDREVATVAGGVVYGSGALGSDGAVWFADYTTASLIRVTSAGAVKHYPLQLAPQSSLHMLAPVSDGFLALALSGNDGVLYHVDSAGSSREVVRDPGLHWRFPRAPLVASRSGSIVVADATHHQLVVAQRDGRMRRIPVGSGEPTFAAFAPDETLWFTEAGLIGHVEASGRIALRPISIEESNGAETRGIAVAPDGTVWTLLAHVPHRNDRTDGMQQHVQMDDATLLRMRPGGAVDVFPFTAIAPTGLTLDFQGAPIFVDEHNAEIFRKTT